MFNQGGLSLEQAPPISVVLKFFITASLFGVMLGLYLSTDSLFDLPDNSYAFDLVVVHLLALGVMASFMFGALFQMLPVIAGVVIKMPQKKSTVSHVLLTLGVITQILAFVFTTPLLYLLASIILGAGLLHTTTLMLKELFKINDHSSSSRGMIVALASFSIAILLGIYLLLSLGGYLQGDLFASLKTAHYSFALFGWVSVLIISVSFQVVEMFYVTPKYPHLMSHYLVLLLVSLLILKLIALLMNIPTQWLTVLLALSLMSYAGVTIHRLYHRRRPTSDATVWFWRLGMGLLMLSMIILMTQQIMESYPFAWLQPLSYLAFIGFGLSIVFAMIYKIIPFLVWFHLSNQGYLEAPMMHDVIHPKQAKIHFAIHLAMLLAWAGAMSFEHQGLIILASLLTTLSFGWLLYHTLMALKKYNYTQKYTEKMEW